MPRSWFALLRPVVGLIGLVSVAAAGACDRGHTAVTFGEPVGVRLDDPNDPSAALEAAFAVPAGQSPDPLIPAVARVLHGAAKACPALGPLTKRGEALRFTARIDHGQLKLDDQSAPGPELACVRAAVANQRMQDDAEPPVPLVIEIAAPRGQVKP